MNTKILQKVNALHDSIITAGTHLNPTIKVAEAAKVIENSQRDIKIAFVNELSMIFNRLGIDTNVVLEATGTKWNFLPFRPSLVYGPWRHPDMSPMLFADAITHNRPIKVFNHGDMSRDFTYIDDIIDGIVNVIDKPSQNFSVYNIGSHTLIQLLDFIGEIKKAFGKISTKVYMDMQPGDVKSTYANVNNLITNRILHLQMVLINLSVNIKNFMTQVVIINKTMSYLK